MGTQVKFRHLRENENMAKKLKSEKSSILQNFRTAFDEAVKKMSFKLGLRKSKVPKRSNDMSRAESDLEIACMGSNFSNPPVIVEIPKTNDPLLVKSIVFSSKTQKDSKPIKTE